VTRRPPAHCSSPEIAFAERCAEIDLSLDTGEYFEVFFNSLFELDFLIFLIFQNIETDVNSVQG
jgi:hypothetical protein